MKFNNPGLQFLLFTSVPPQYRHPNLTQNGSSNPGPWPEVHGRWLLVVSQMSNGQLIASLRSQQPEAKHETPTGWGVHYTFGIAYAYVLFILIQLGIFEPTITHGLVFGVVSVSVLWLFFMPAMGNGIMASKTPNPKVVCTLALMMHSLFGLSFGVGFSMLIF